MVEISKTHAEKTVSYVQCDRSFADRPDWRLMYIEYTSGDKYEKIVLSQQEYDSQTIPYQRGDIVDSKGTVLATSIAVYNVILDCSVMTSKR